jgi:hypothetical protein
VPMCGCLFSADQIASAWRRIGGVSSAPPWAELRILTSWSSSGYAVRLVLPLSHRQLLASRDNVWLGGVQKPRADT